MSLYDYAYALSSEEIEAWGRARVTYTRETVGRVGWKDWHELPTETRVSYYMKAFYWTSSGSRPITLIGIEAVHT